MIPYGRTIVVLDESDEELREIATALREVGHRVLTHKPSAGGTVALVLESPDLVLIEVTMASAEGDALVGLFGTARADGKAIVLLHSKLPAEVLEAKARASGADGYVKKSSDMRALTRTLQAWLGRSARSGQLPAAEPVSNPKPVSSGTFDTAPIAVLLVDPDMARLAKLRASLQRRRATLDFALSADHALSLLGSGASFDVVVCNTKLGNQSGQELYDRARQLRPALNERFVFVSESAAPDVSGEVLLRGGRTLRTPIDPDELWAAIQQRLRAEPGVLTRERG